MTGVQEGPFIYLLIHAFIHSLIYLRNYYCVAQGSQLHYIVQTGTQPSCLNLPSAETTGGNNLNEWKSLLLVS